MKNILKGKLGTALILIVTVILAGVAIFTAVRLYQLGNQPVAPNVPSSIPQAHENNGTACSLTFTVSTVVTPTPTPTPTPTLAPTEGPTSVPTSAPTEIPTAPPTSAPTQAPTSAPAAPNNCGGTCGSNYNCNGGLFCYQGFCRNPSCSTQTDCNCPGTSAPTTAPVAARTSAPVLPSSGTDWPTLVGGGFGILVIIGSLLLAL